jgi:hypothetical protein
MKDIFKKEIVLYGIPISGLTLVIMATHCSPEWSIIPFTILFTIPLFFSKNKRRLISYLIILIGLLALYLAIERFVGHTVIPDRYGFMMALFIPLAWFLASPAQAMNLIWNEILNHNN